MFESCPKKNNTKCTFATFSTWHPHKKKYTDTTYLYCGLATGYDNRVKALPKCWKDMNAYQKTKVRKGY